MTTPVLPALLSTRANQRRTHAKVESKPVYALHQQLLGCPTVMLHVEPSQRHGLLLFHQHARLAQPHQVNGTK